MTVSTVTIQHGVLTLVLVLLASAPAAQTMRAGSTHDFQAQARSYSFTATFELDAPPGQVLDLLYSFEHFQRFARRSHCELLEEGPDWQRVRYTHSTSLWTITATLRRQLDRPAGCVWFEMESAARSGLPIPLPTASSGHYCVEPVETGLRVTYHQAAETDASRLRAIWLRHARSEAVAFANDMEAYVRANAR
jgi:hypothetical protein